MPGAREFRRSGHESAPARAHPGFTASAHSRKTTAAAAILRLSRQPPPPRPARRLGRCLIWRRERQDEPGGLILPLVARLPNLGQKLFQAADLRPKGSKRAVTFGGLRGLAWSRQGSLGAP